jgi:ABC-2 type transport system permease protein
MNPAIWKKAVSDAWLQLLISSLILVLFAWVFVWLMSQLPNRGFGAFLRWLPNWIEPLFGVPLAKLAEPTGQLSLIFVHVVTLLISVGWAVSRGSDSISGEITRGTMDLILSLPVRRASILVAPAVVATLGGAVLAAAILLGISLGMLSFDFGSHVAVRQFLPGAVNLFCLLFFMTGITTCISSWNQNRWRTISLAAGFYVVSVIVEMIGRLWKWGDWLKYCSFSTAFQPHRLILQPEETGLWAWSYNVPLVALGLVAYAAAAVILSHRDIPAGK